MFAMVGLDKDERDDFLRRESELGVQLAKKLLAADKPVCELKEELAFLQKQDMLHCSENKSTSGRLYELHP